jgi:hypothetical protein
LRVHVERDRHEIAIAGALAIAEQAALDPVGARHQPQLGRRDAGAAVVVRVERDHHAVAVGDIAAEPFDLVGIDVGRRASTVAGRLRISGFSGVGRSTSITAAQTSTEKSSSAVEKVSGNIRTPVGAGCFAASSRRIFAPSTAICRGSRRAHAEHDRRQAGRDRVVEMDDRAARLRRLSKLVSIRSRRDWVSTWTVTSSGMRPATRPEMKSNSVAPAGKPTSISLMPILHEQVEEALSSSRRPSDRSAPGCRRACRSTASAAPG